MEFLKRFLHLREPPVSRHANLAITDGSRSDELKKKKRRVSSETYRSVTPQGAAAVVVHCTEADGNLTISDVRESTEPKKKKRRISSDPDRSVIPVGTAAGVAHCTEADVNLVTGIETLCEALDELGVSTSHADAHFDESDEIIDVMN